MTELKPTLHHLNHSQSQGILWLLEELEIPYNLKQHERQTSGPKEHRSPPELYESHPLGKSPQLETGDGRVIIERAAIAQYLIKTYDTAGSFKSEDEIHDEELTHLAGSSIGPIMSLEMVFEILEKRSPFFVRFVFSGAHSMMSKQFTGPELEAYFKYLDNQLGDKDYFAGSNLTRADIMVSWPVDFCVQRKYVDLAKHPNLQKWNDRCKARPAWQETMKKCSAYDLARY